MGWLLFVALYAICVVCAVIRDMASYGSASVTPWHWRWALLAAPWLMLSEAWDNLPAAWRAFRRR